MQLNKVPEVMDIFDNNLSYSLALCDIDSALEDVLVAGDKSIIIFNSHEGYVCWDDIDKIHRFAIQHNIPSDRFVFIGGDVNLESQYYKWLAGTLEYIPTVRPANYDPIHVFGFSYMEYSLLLHIAEFNERFPEYDFLEYSRVEFPTKIYTSFNSMPKYHRTKLVVELKSANLESVGHLSIGWEDKFLKAFDNIYYRGEKNDAGRPEIQVKYEDVAGGKYGAGPWLIFDKSAFVNDSYFSIVTETLPMESDVMVRNVNSTIFPTEKIWVTILQMSPFILIGEAGTLRYLRSIGYETYPELFDESYDDILNLEDRIDAIMVEVRKICEMPADDRHSLFSSVKDKTMRNAAHILKDTSRWDAFVRRLRKCTNTYM